MSTYRLLFVCIALKNKNVYCSHMRFFVVALSVLLFSPYAWSQSVKQAHTDVSLLSSVSAVAPGQSFLVAVRMQMDPHWHVYWKNPGDSGLSPQIRWHLPSGWTAGEIQWPVPQRIHLPPLAVYGYENEVLLLTEIFPSSQHSRQTPVQIEADLRWLACRVNCVSGKAVLKKTLDVHAENPILDSILAETFAQARQRLPQRESPWQENSQLFEDKWQLHFLGQPIPTQAQFFPDRDDVIVHAAQQILLPSSDGFSLLIPKSNILQENPKELSGLLLTDQGHYLIQAPVQQGVILATQSSLWLMCIFAFFGGILLNIMPCVLPVLFLKILSLVKHHNHRGQSIKHGLAFTGGVLISFWVLAALLVMIKSAGASIGWGFQFQSPVFVGGMALVFFVLALNLFGFFEIGLSFTRLGNLTQKMQGLGASFWNGFLATVVATPCTAPFMGVAMGYALTQSVLIIVLIFTCLGLGMALPMMVLSAFPSLLRFVPKPGPWMNGLKRAMGVLMLISMMWLLWILIVQFHGIENKWETYSPQVVTNLQEQGKDYLLDFTAAWCLTCQVNDKLVLQHPKVVQKLKEKNIVLIKADWSKYDPVITEALAGYGRSSIPLYVLYSARRGEEQVLGESLGVAQLIQLLDQH